MRETRPKIKLILEFLQEGLARGLSTSTLKHLVATLNSVIGAERWESISAHPLTRRFYRVFSLLNLPMVH